MDRFILGNVSGEEFDAYFKNLNWPGRMAFVRSRRCEIAELANPKILDCVRVMYYGAPVPLTNVATVTVPDARTIMITPWEKKIIKDIEKGIMDSEVGITPENNGEVIRLGIPPLTEERRKQLAKQCKGEGETAKVSVRNARRDGIDALKKAVKDGLAEDEQKNAEAKLQKIHDKYIKQIEDMLADKDKEIMTV